MLEMITTIGFFLMSIAFLLVLRQSYIDLAEYSKRTNGILKCWSAANEKFFEAIKRLPDETSLRMANELMDEYKKLEWHKKVSIYEHE
jgi:hypothetical protein